MKKKQKNYFEAWLVKRIGATRQAELVEMYDRFHPEFDTLKTFTIFPSKKQAYIWRNLWKNKEDFDVFMVKIPNV